MSLLGLWEVSIALSAVSLLIMAGLIVARLFSERKQANLAARRAELLPYLLSGELEVCGLLPKGEADAQTTDLLVDLIGVVRGDERDSFVALANRLGADRQLIRRLETGAPRIKVGAAEALANFPDERATAALDRALDDKSKDVRLTAALALTQSGRAPPLSFLIERLSLGRTENSLLLITLLQHVVNERPEEVEALLDDPTTPAIVKAAAIDALAAFGRYQVAPAINRLALQTDPQSEELARYLRALGALRHPAGIPAVNHHLNAPTWWVRAAAAEAAGKIGITEAIPRLTALLDDEDWWVRFRASEALSSLGDQGIATLRAAGCGSSERAAQAARLTLTERGIAIDG